MPVKKKRITFSRDNNIRLKKLEKDGNSLKADVAQLKEDVGELRKNTQTLVDIFDTAKHSAKFFMGLGKIVRWFISLFILGAFVYSLIFAIKHGLPIPSPPSVFN